jgi:hypothetical protein
MEPLTVHTVLRAWETARDRHPLDRALVLYALAAPDLPPDSLADQPLGRRNEALLRLHRATYGNLLSAYLDCPRCQERLEFELAASALLPDLDRDPEPLVVDGHRFRLPTSRDLAGIAGEADVGTASQNLLRSCLVDPDGGAAGPALLERVETAMEDADPLADLALDVACEACGHAWSAPFDIAGFLWEEIDAHARRLLDEVHRLAGAYGWSESEILALSPARRAAYLARVTS